MDKKIPAESTSPWRVSVLRSFLWMWWLIVREMPQHFSFLEIGVELHTKHGRGKLLYIFDADVYFINDWLNWLLYLYDTHHEQFKIIAGGVHPFLQPREGERTQYVTSHDAISGWSGLLDYATWDKYGKLADNALGTGKSEDWEYCQRIRKDGYLVGCCDPQVVAHCGMTNSEGMPIPGKEVSEQLAKLGAPEAVLL